MGYTESLRDGVLSPDPETFEIIHDEAQNLSRLVQDLRTLSLADAGKLALHLERLPPSELLQTVAAKYRHQAERQNISLTVQAEASLPEVEIDLGRMEQVLGNLVSNALRYTPANGEILLTAVQSDPTHLQLTVQDNGPGIPPDTLPKIFNRFYKVDESPSGARRRIWPGFGHCPLPGTNAWRNHSSCQSLPEKAPSSP
ncbi:MAG: HAMP domain-containing histidine kinase [Chloroflexi bacterium]|nr:HAMP domain-containing histidine kinase [Chloroflexota bacterium]